MEFVAFDEPMMMEDFAFEEAVEFDMIEEAEPEANSIDRA
jgi:hypothetical protein